MLAEAGADITVEPWGEGRIVTVRASRLDPSTARCPATLRPRPSSSLPAAWSRAARSRWTASTAAPPGWGTCRSSSGWAPTSRFSPDRERAPSPSGATRRPAAGHGGTRRRDPLPRRDPRPRRGRGGRPGHHGLLRRRRAAGQGGRPAGGGGRHGRRLRRIRRGRRGHPVDPGSGGPLRGARSTAVGITAWPWRPPSPPWPPARAPQPITGFGAVETSYPGFAATAPLTGRARRPAALLIAIDGPAGAGKSTVSRAGRGAPRRPPARYGCDVPCRRRPRTGPHIAPRRPAAVAALAAGLEIEVGPAGGDRRPGRHRRDPLARGGAGRLAWWPPTPRSGGTWCRASGTGGRHAAGWSRAGTSAAWSSPRPAQGLPHGVTRGAGAAPKRRVARRGGPAGPIDSTRAASPLAAGRRTPTSSTRPAATPRM